jgi:threonine synthase
MTETTYLTHLECNSCGTKMPFDVPQNNTCADGGILEARYDEARIQDEVSRDDIAKGPPSLWRYGPVLPVIDPANIVTLGEGWTPLIHAERLGSELGCSELFVKDEGRNPTGAFKDRGAAMVVSKMKELGIKTFIHNSSGNAAGALSLYAARAGLDCVNIVPDDILPSCQQQVALSGCRAYMMKGPWHESGRLVAANVEKHGWFNAGTLKEPYRLEGKKTMGCEIAEQLGWDFPDVVIYPTGGGLGAIGIFKAFAEFERLGWVDSKRKPRLVAVQYEGCAPIVRAYRDGKDHAEAWLDVQILPGGLKSATPPGDRDVLRIVRETGGTCLTVTGDEALEAAAHLARTEGVFACPESATTLAALKKLLGEGTIDGSERIVAMITGAGIKSVDNFKPVNLPTISSNDLLPG